ncbi:MAG: hypothetical protein K2O15_00875 [Lachnospiraceae bacterium]|nr:hypothetical protein [Lachnospiraceae bacterium]
MGSCWLFDPVNVNTGNFVYEKEDLVIRGITKLSFHMTYYSMKENAGGRITERTDREVRLCYRYRVLCQFINSSGQNYTYRYNENLRLESVTTPRDILAVKNVYDSVNRVVELRYDDKGVCTYAKN